VRPRGTAKHKRIELKTSSEFFLFAIIASMTATVLRSIGNCLYFMGALILVPVGEIFIGSVNTLMMAGPIVLLVPVLGIAFAGIGKWMKHKARQIEGGRGK
jgi:hypothetical protein